jgi:subtilisin family serine protease
MKKMMPKALFMIILMVAIVGLFSDEMLEKGLTNQLNQKLSQVENTDFIEINIRLNSYYSDTNSLTIPDNLTKQEKREFVIAELQSFSSEKQHDLLQFLAEKKNEGLVKDINPLWITNVVSCSVAPETILELEKKFPDYRYDYDEKRNLLLDTRKSDKKEDALSNTREITWNVSYINADDVWGLGFDGTGILVSVLDTGVNYNHTDLSDHMWNDDFSYPNHGYDFVNSDNDPMDDQGHGTHCAGTIAGDGTSGSQTGVAPGTTIMALKILDSAGSGTESGVWNAIQFSIDNNADVMSMSIGWLHAWGVDRVSWRDSMVNAMTAGVVAAVAAGNEGDQIATYPIPDNIRTPGDCPPPWLHPDQTLTGGTSSVITVGATDSSGNIGYFSGLGPVTWQAISGYNDYAYNPGMGLIRPDLSAPGVNIKSLAYNSNTGYEDGWNGTSMATPAVAGVIALMLQKNPTLTPAQISEILETTVQNPQTPKNNTYGSGIVDALEAIQAITIGGVQNPQTFTATSASTSQINLAWTKNTDNNDVMLAWSANGIFGTPIDETVYNDGDTIPGGGTVLYSGALTSYEHTDLDASTTYYYRAFSYNASNEYSSGRIANATTDCGAFTSFPFNEGFEGGTLPNCWSYAGTAWAYQAGGYGGNPSGAHSGSYNAFFYHGSSTADVSKLITPQFDFTGYTSPSLTFWHAQALWPSDQDELRVYYKTSSGGSWVQLAAYTDNITAWTQRTISLPNLTNDYYIAFEATGQYGYGVVLDDIQITATPISEDPPVAVVTPESFTQSLLPDGTDSDNFNISNTGGENLTYEATISYTPPSLKSQRAYCATSYSNTSDDWITNVQFNTINNSSGSVGYEDFTSISTEVLPGESYELIVDIQVQGAWFQHCWVWFDWDQNEDFTDTGEAFDLGDNGGDTGPYQFSQMITIPATASLGSTRMRIAERYNSDPESCTQTTYGEAEDYTIIIADANPMTWLSFSGQPTVSGTITPSGNENIPVNFDAAGLEIGTYQAQINITTNDPYNSAIQVPVTLVVEEVIELTAPVNLTITTNSGLVSLSWSAVVGANSYYVYSATEPNAVDWGVPIDHVELTEFSETSSDSKKFYKVTASTDVYSSKTIMGTTPKIIPLKSK